MSWCLPPLPHGNGQLITPLSNEVRDDGAESLLIVKTFTQDMKTEPISMSDLAIPSGEYLEEVLEDLKMSQAELAKKMGRPSQVLNEIIKGEKAITPEIALQLETILKVSADIWIQLESEYRLIRAKPSDEVFVRWGIRR